MLALLPSRAGDGHRTCPPRSCLSFRYSSRADPGGPGPGLAVPDRAHQPVRRISRPRARPEAYDPKDRRRAAVSQAVIFSGVIAYFPAPGFVRGRAPAGASTRIICRPIRSTLPWQASWRDERPFPSLRLLSSWPFS
jgi:hypothetical protein